MVNVCDVAPVDRAATCVVDLPTQFDEYVLALVEAADEVLLVGEHGHPERQEPEDRDAGARPRRRSPGPKLRLVLNRANTQVKLDVREIEQVLGLRADFPIPSDIAVPMSVNAGVPVVDHEPKVAATRALEHIAESLLGRDAATGARKTSRRDAGGPKK